MVPTTMTGTVLPMLAPRRRALETLCAARKRYQAALMANDEDARFHARAALRQAEARWGREWQKEQRWYH